jgi:DNA-binding beta-propeller fold protein YncE
MRLSILLTVLTILPAVAWGQQAKLPLKTVVDIPLSGRASRLDYQSFDPASGRLYIAHLGDDMLTVFDTASQKVIGDVGDVKHVHGVLAVPELHRVYASATGTNELAVIDDQSLKIVARIPAGDYPDGIAYASKEKKIYVSDLHGKTDTAIDPMTNKLIATIPLDGGAGNTQYDAVSGRILVAVHSRNEIVEIDPQTDTVAQRYPLDGCNDPHGLLIDASNRIAFAACEGNSKLVVFDLAAKKQLNIFSCGTDPDVLAFDNDLGRLYVSGEKGIISIFDERKSSTNGPVEVKLMATGFLASKAHTVAVNNKTHDVYFPLENVDGRPVLRIVRPE